MTPSTTPCSIADTSAAQETLTVAEIGWHTFRHDRSWIGGGKATMSQQKDMMRHADIATTALERYVWRALTMAADMGRVTDDESDLGSPSSAWVNARRMVTVFD
jgi:hypothetical protein